MFKKMGKVYLSVSLLYVILGIFMLAAQDVFIDVAFYILGGALALFGLVEIISYFAKSDSFIGLTGGIIALVLGLYMLFNNKNITNFLFFIFGLILLADNAAGLKTVFELRRAKVKLWWLSLLFTLLFMAAGIFILFNPSWMAKAIIYVVGIMFILNGISNVWNYFMVKKSLRDLENAAADSMPVATFNADGSSYDPDRR